MWEEHVTTGHLLIEDACGGVVAAPPNNMHLLHKQEQEQKPEQKQKQKQRRQRQKQNHKQKQNQKQKQPSNSLLLSPRFGPECATIIASSWRRKGRSRSRSRRIFRTLPAEPLKLQLGMRGATIAFFLFEASGRPTVSPYSACGALEIST